MICTNHTFYKDDITRYTHIEFLDHDSTPGNLEAHSVVEIIYLVKGSLLYTIEGKQFKVPDNSLIFTRPGKMHFIDLSDKSIYNRYAVMFEKKQVREDIYNKIPDNLHVLNVVDYPEISSLFQKMEYYYKYFDGEDFKNILLHLIDELLYNIVIISKEISQKMDVPYSANSIVLRAIEYIENNLNGDLSLDSLCNEFHITKVHMNRLFEQHMQTSPKKYINAKRLETAQKLICRGKKPIDVYLRCGFSEYTTFFRAYTKYFGYSPSQTSMKKNISESSL